MKREDQRAFWSAFRIQFLIPVSIIVLLTVLYVAARIIFTFP